MLLSKVLNIIPFLAVAHAVISRDQKMKCTPSSNQHSVSYDSKNEGADIEIKAYSPKCDVISPYKYEHPPAAQASNRPLNTELKPTGWKNGINIIFPAHWN
ncbi:hypothetical protein BJ875DRAFT_438572 [Amylocarpus encephaloides]|uniref:Uncharacterized protein n=1 Tax=Amylocarpus encephaloides TaxID=45428 RepID=A0A9P8C818_9HELO|nr:hypothetical protein BJ875DRAFT_438572 [Amylocarpus encephaloides]